MTELAGFEQVAATTAACHTPRGIISEPGGASTPPARGHHLSGGSDVPNPTPIERLWRRRLVTSSGCWEWTGRLSDDGYGRWTVGGLRGRSTHRWAYEALVEPIPEGMEVDHLCRNRACFNPTHLQLVTHIENVRRGSHAMKTHCKHGHPFTPANTIYHARSGCRQCRECKLISQRASYAARRGA